MVSGIPSSHAHTVVPGAEVFVRVEPLIISTRRTRTHHALAHGRTVKNEAIDTGNTTVLRTVDPIGSVITIEDESDDGASFGADDLCLD